MGLYPKPFLICWHSAAREGLYSMEREGTRIKCEIPLTLISLDPTHPFSGPCLAILANPNGCAVRCNHSLNIGTTVRLEGLPTESVITARVVNCISLGPYEKVRILGLALDRPGNVWGIKNPPQDWSPQSLSTISAIPKPLILCLEDNPTYLALRKKVLERDGYEVISVTTVGEAVKALRQFPICTTVADHLLQGATGTQLARDMKKIKPQVPIILFSGAVPENLDGIDVYLNKGEPAAKFLEIVRAVVERYRS
jgi:CheY-like chemotaxis protein